MNLKVMTKRLAQVTTKTLEQAGVKPSRLARDLTPQVDSFHDGVRVRAGRGEVHLNRHATGASVSFGADTFGVSGRVIDGPATLGAVAVKAGRLEVSVGLVPAAPSPMPMPVYVGPVRED